jgi:hypothetical protein
MDECNMRTNLISARFQAISLIISMILLGIVLTIRYQEFVNFDPPYSIEKHADTHSYQTITTGFHLINFIKFNVAQNVFEFIGTVWFAYDPSVVSLETIKKFAIYNGTIVDMSEPSIAKMNNITIARFRIHGKFHTSLYYKLFPFDDHALNIVITNEFLPKNVIFASSHDAVTIDPGLEMQGWHVRNWHTTSGYAKWLLEKSPAAQPTENTIDQKEVIQKMVFTFLIENDNPMLALNIALTLLLLLFISLLTFSSDQDCVLIVTVGMVALIGYRFVLQSFEPSSINYFTLADYMYLFALIGTILTLFGGIISREQSDSLMIKKWFIIGIYTLFISGCAVISFIL